MAETKVTLKGVDELSPVIKGTTKSVQELTKELEKSLKIGESQSKALQIRAKETNRSYLELLQTIKKNNQAYNENLKNIINGTGALNQQATAAKGVASALAGMAARYISLGGAAEAGRRSFVNFAETEKKLLLLQNRTKATADEIERTGKKVKQTSQDTATGFDDTLASIERMRTGLKMSTADAEKMSARVNVVAQGMGVTSEELSKSVTSAMRNLKIPSDQLSQVLEMQAAAQREF